MQFQFVAAVVDGFYGFGGKMGGGSRSFVGLLLWVSVVGTFPKEKHCLRGLGVSSTVSGLASKKLILLACWAHFIFRSGL